METFIREFPPQCCGLSADSRKLTNHLAYNYEGVRQKWEARMHIEFKRLSEINKNDIIDLMNQPLLRRHMPLMGDSFTEEDCEAFVAAKENIWAENGYGPWAFVMDGKFAGWGGLQPENGDVDLALVLHPQFWGIGGMLYEKIIERAFVEMGLESVTILLPPTRTRVKGILSLGFVQEGEVDVGGEQFIRYRLNSPHNP